MKHYIVWGMNKVDHRGQEYPQWFIVGVFRARTAEGACQAAAKKSQRVGSYFAVEGYPWGIDLVDIDATEFGVEASAADKLTQLQDRIERQDRELSRLEQLEVRSREMEREAGIGDES